MIMLQSHRTQEEQTQDYKFKFLFFINLTLKI